MDFEMRDGILNRAEERRQRAFAIVEEIGLLERWGAYGRPVIVGAMAYGLVHAPDIDMEVYCPDLRVEHGFEVLGGCAASSPRVSGALFQNHLHDPDGALYWSLTYRDDDGVEWKADMWSAPDNYSLPRSETIVEPMNRALTDETRAVILWLKECRETDPSLKCLSIDLYRAVLDDDVCDPDGLRDWLATHKTGELTGWMPGSAD